MIASTFLALTLGILAANLVSRYVYRIYALSDPNSSIIHIWKADSKNVLVNNNYDSWILIHQGRAIIYDPGISLVGECPPGTENAIIFPNIRACAPKLDHVKRIYQMRYPTDSLFFSSTDNNQIIKFLTEKDHSIVQ